MKIVIGLILGVLVMSGFSANAQSKFKVGAGIGINNSSFTGIDATGTTTLSGLNVGAISEFKFSDFSGIELNVLFSMKGASAIYFSNQKKLTRGDRFNYVDLPLVLKLYVKKIISFQAGVQYSKLLSANIAGVDVKNLIRGDDCSAVFGVGIDLERIHTSFRYNHGLSNISLISSDLRSNMIAVALGIWIKNN